MLSTSSLQISHFYLFWQFEFKTTTYPLAFPLVWIIVIQSKQGLFVGQFLLKFSLDSTQKKTQSNFYEKTNTHWTLGGKLVL